MKCWVRWLACVLALPASVAGAGEPDAVIWQGSLGAQRIIVEQTSDMAAKSDCGGRYFYERHRVDIRLEGKPGANGVCTMQEWPPRWDDGTPKPEWRMRVPAGERWQGEWIGVDGRSLPIRLSRVTALPDALEPSLTALRRDFDPYAYLRLSALKLQPVKRESVNGFALRWLRQPDSDIRLFEVTSGYAPEAQRAINRTLHRQLWQWVEDQYECRSGGAPGEAGFDMAEATLRHIDARVVSVSLNTSYYCGGAHPDFGDSPLNIDARNGRELRLEDVLWVGQGRPVHENESPDELDDAWMDYQRKTFAPWVVSQLQRLYPGEMTRDPDGDSCDYADPEVWDFSSWYVLPTGIHLAAYFPRVMRMCDDPEWAVLPWSVVDAHPGDVRLH